MSTDGLKTGDFDYRLPEELIASRPSERRDASRMLVVERATGVITHRMFREFPGLLPGGGLCVLNDTRVVRSRFFSDDGRVELVRVDTLGERHWRCLVRPGKRMKPGRQVRIGDAVGTVESVFENGERLVVFDRPVDETRFGQLALPHYMGREVDAADDERYQTVYARQEGAIAAPTAGLHFTPEILGRVPHVFVTLHVGVGTFRPVKAERVEEHRMHIERFQVGEEAAARINAAPHVTAVGTTSARVLEHLGRLHDGRVVPGPGETDIFIYPGFAFRVVDALLTNFHLPKSTLLMLVSAFAGRELILEAYARAVEERYRFFSYGDCMLIL